MFRENPASERCGSRIFFCGEECYHSGGALWSKVGSCGKEWSRVFMGEFQHSLDDKARLTVPAKFREELGSAFVVTRGLDRCLFAYPRSDWEALEEKLRSLPLTRADARQFIRFFFSGATECELDKQGRIVVPSNLREYASISRDCVVIGVGARVEIWDQELWKSYTSDVGNRFGELAESLVDLDL